MQTFIRLSGCILFGAAIWFSPKPAELVPEAWQLFAIFVTAIAAVVSGAIPILLAAILALVVAILTNTLQPEIAYGGFSESFILLIVIAFLVGRGVVNSGLGTRVGYILVRSFGTSSLGLAYSMVATDALIAPAFPSNTARSGVLYPIVYALAENNASHPWEDSRLRVGAYLMMTSMAGLGLSSGLWLTAMAANPVGVAIAADRGVAINFGSWFLASSVPTITAMIIIPWLLYKVFPPEIKSTPEAPKNAAAKLTEMGPMSSQEWVTLTTFVGMVVGWAMSSTWGIDATAIAFVGLAILMLTGIFTLADMKASGDALETLIWFAILYTISKELDNLGFMQFAGDILGSHVANFSWPVTYVLLTVIYVLIHYLFVSQTAHMLALFGVFLGLSAGHVPTPLMAMMLLLATNFFSVITPQGSSCNVIFVGSGYLTGGEVYRYGGIATLACLLIFLIIGTPWILWVL